MFPAPASPAEGSKPPGCQHLDELIALPVLSLRVAPALLELALHRVITWAEAAFVLDAIEFYDEVGARQAQIVHRLLGGEEVR